VRRRWQNSSVDKDMKSLPAFHKRLSHEEMSRGDTIQMKVENLYGAFSNALDMIVNSEAPMFEKITNAFQRYLVQLDADTLPEEIKPRFLALKQRFNTNEPIFELDEALNIACEIIDMADVIRITQYNLETEKERRTGAANRRKGYNNIANNRRSGLVDRRKKQVQDSIVR